MSMLVESLGCPEDSAGCWWLVVVVLVVCCYVLFRLSDDNTGTAFLIHVIIEPVTTASKGSEKNIGSADLSCSWLRYYAWSNWQGGSSPWVISCYNLQEHWQLDWLQVSRQVSTPQSWETEYQSARKTDTRLEDESTGASCCIHQTWNHQTLCVMHSTATAIPQNSWLSPFRQCMSGAICAMPTSCGEQRPENENTGWVNTEPVKGTWIWNFVIQNLPKLTALLGVSDAQRSTHIYNKKRKKRSAKRGFEYVGIL